MCKETVSTKIFVSLGIYYIAGNSWDLPKSYREAEQMCIRSSQNTQPQVPSPPYSIAVSTKKHLECGKEFQILNEQPKDSRQSYLTSGIMVGGVGPAVVFDHRSSRSQGPLSVPQSTENRPPTSQPNALRLSGLQVALPPMIAPTERVVPIMVEGLTVYHPQSSCINEESKDTSKSNATIMTLVHLNKVIVFF